MDKKETTSGKPFRIKVIAFQAFGKPIDIPVQYEFCCWKSLWKWMNDCSGLYGCDKCGRLKPLPKKELP